MLEIDEVGQKLEVAEAEADNESSSVDVEDPVSVCALPTDVNKTNNRRTFIFYALYPPSVNLNNY